MIQDAEDRQTTCQRGGDDRAAAAERRAPRDSLFMLATVHRPDRPECSINLRVRNISSGGLMAETPEPFVAGEVIGVELRGAGMVAGRVVWAIHGRIGIAFDTPIDPMLVRRPIAAPAAKPAPPDPSSFKRPWLRVV